MLEKRTHRSVQRVIALAVLPVVALLVLTACIPQLNDQSRPWFSTPVEWGNGFRIGAAQHAKIVNVPTQVRLADQGNAQLTDFPIGKNLGAKSAYCLEVNSPDTYTGKATWSYIDGYTVILKFAGADVRVSPDKSGLGDQDWTSLNFSECDGTDWSLLLVCGIPGYGGPGKKAVSSEEGCRP